jgi:niacin transporter
MKNVRTLTITALLTAFAIIIPLYFGFLSIKIPPFSATIASHVPMFLAMLLGPGAAVFVGIGSALGFFITTGPVIGARAAMHTFVGLAGALLLKKGVSFKKVVAITAPLHAGLEAIVVIVLTGRIEFALVAVGIGTFIHHFVDGTISFALIKALTRPGNSIFNQNKKVA